MTTTAPRQQAIVASIASLIERRAQTTPDVVAHRQKTGETLNCVNAA